MRVHSHAEGALSSTTEPAADARQGRFVVSPVVYVVCWWCVFAMHFFNGTLASTFAGTYFFFGKPEIYPTTHVLGISLALIRISGWSYASLACLHWISLGRMILWSLRKRSLTLIDDITGPTPTTMATTTRSPITSMSTKVRAYYRLLWGPWNRTFGVDGIFGVNGRHFYDIFLLREALEIGLQTYQANQLSGAVRRAWVTHLAVVTIVLNCFSSTLVDLVLHKHQDTTVRFAKLLVDMALDFCCAAVIPICVAYPYVALYDSSIGSFPFALVNDDTWFVTSIAEVRLFCVSSATDLVATMMPHVTVYTCLKIAKKLIQRDSPGASNRQPPGHKLKRIAMSIVAVNRVSSGANAIASPSRHASSLSPAAQQRVAFTPGQKRLHQAFQVAITLWAIAVVVVHTNANAYAASSIVKGCRLPRNTWFATKAPCVVMQINCYRDNIQGHASEIAHLLEPLDRKVLTKLLITHCPQLEIPMELLQFNDMRDLDLYNSTLVSWPMEAAATPTNLASLTNIYWYNSAYIGFPDGLLHDNLPPSFSRFYIAKSNVTELPDELGTLWAKWYLDILSVQFTQLLRLPSTFHALRMRKIRLISNQLTVIPDSALSTKRLEVLHLSGNPLVALPQSLGDTSRLVELLVEHTQVTTLPPLVEQWWNEKAVSGRKISSLFGSPFCTTNASDGYAYKLEICGTDMGNAKGTHPWDVIDPQRPLDA